MLDKKSRQKSIEIQFTPSATKLDHLLMFHKVNHLCTGQRIDKDADDFANIIVVLVANSLIYIQQKCSPIFCTATLIVLYALVLFFKERIPVPGTNTGTVTCKHVIWNLWRNNCHLYFLQS